jgi:hypothetical protein
MTINIYALQFSSDMIPTSRILDRIICRVVGVDDDWNACLNDKVHKYIIHLIRGW